MPIYEYYCPNNNKIYQFYAKTLAQGQTLPRCPENPAYRMERRISAFAVIGKGKKGESGEPATPAELGGGGGPQEDARMEAAMAAMEGEFAHVDENDPRAMGRMMRRMAELSGEKIDGEMEEVVRKLEEGMDPESLEDQLGGEAPPEEGSCGPGAGEAPNAADSKELRPRFRTRRGPPVRDPKLYDYD